MRGAMLGFVLLTTSAMAQDAVRTVKVADGVFAILQPDDNRFNDANSVLIVGPTSAIVIDSQVSPASAHAFIAEIRKLTDKPVRHVVATHWHGDHFQGNQAYRDAWPDVEFVAHASAADEMRTRATRMLDDDIARLTNELARTGLRLNRGVDLKGQPLDRDAHQLLFESLARGHRRLSDLKSVEFVFPTTLVGEETIWNVGREVRLLHFRGHTAGDLAVYLPAERVLITGDLVDDMPYLGHGFPSEYLRALDSLTALDWNLMVPGHGQVRRGKDHVRLVAEVFSAVYADVRRAMAAGLPPEYAVSRVNLESYREKLSYGDASAAHVFDAFMPKAVARMYEELSAKPGK